MRDNSPIVTDPFQTLRRRLAFVFLLITLLCSAAGIYTLSKAPAVVELRDTKLKSVQELNRIFEANQKAREQSLGGYIWMGAAAFSGLLWLSVRLSTRSDPNLAQLP